MNNNFLKKTVVALLCLGFVFVAVPTMNSAERKAPHSGIFQMIKMPSLLISSAIPALGSIFDPGSIFLTPAKGPIDGKVKPTDDIQIPKPGSGN